MLALENFISIKNGLFLYLNALPIRRNFQTARRFAAPYFQLLSLKRSLWVTNNVIDLPGFAKKLP
jgi:hypothetical protein